MNNQPRWWRRIRFNRKTDAKSNAANPSGTPSPSNRENTGSLGVSTSNFSRDLRAATLIVVAFYLVAGVFLGFALQSAEGSKPLSWTSVFSLVSIALAVWLIAAAAACLGALLGFIFGIPRELQSGSAAEDSKYVRYIANTNLEQISDWLTKIIVGVSLIQIGNLRPALADLGRNLEPMLGSSVTSGGVGVAVCLSASISGFLLAYLWTRVIVTRLFALTGSDLEEYAKRTAGVQAVELNREGIEAAVAKTLHDNDIVDETQAETILKSFRDELNRLAITVNFAPFDPRLGPLQVQLPDHATVQDLLNSVYFALPASVPAFGYGTEWLLRRQRDGVVLSEMGTRWAEAGGHGADSRPLKMAGIEPGDTLDVIPGPAHSPNRLRV